MQRISISGVQDKVSLRLDRGKLSTVERDGTHILKPVPATPFRLAADMPANEHCTMLLASRLGINTAAHGLVRLADGQLAYVTRRFDRKPTGRRQKSTAGAAGASVQTGHRLHQEDLSILIDASKETRGDNWKYDASYEEIGYAIAKYCGAQQRDLREFLRRVVFSFIVGNGDAHIRNFSVLRDDLNRVSLSPAYDLLCTKIHLPHDNDLALAILDRERGGLYSTTYEGLGFYSRADFLQLARALAIPELVANDIITTLTNQAAQDIYADVLDRAFLSHEARDLYRLIIKDQQRKLLAN
jgi:serine/threonine-protein kinase HipA